MPIVVGPSSPAGGTAVPTDGSFVNANWVEVFHPSHDYTGRTIITNGLLLLDFQTGQTRLCRIWLWNTALATPAWQQVADLIYNDNGANMGTLRALTVQRVGAEETQINTASSSAGNKTAQVNLRVMRGRYDVRVDFGPSTETSVANTSLALTLVATPKIAYNSTKVVDVVLGETATGFTTDYGYAAAFVANSAQPFVTGLLYQNQSSSVQPNVNSGSPTIGIGDNAAPLIVGSRRAYGFFAIPYGVNASYSTANLQAEAESGTLASGWTSQAGAGSNSNSLEAKCASGTVVAHDDIFGTAFVPNPGTYDVWFRAKVTTNVGSASEMTFGLWNSTDSVYVSSTTFNRTSLTTSYAWYRAAAGVTPTATKSMRFRAVTAATLGTDWFVDEAIMVPLTLTTDDRGPQDLWQQFAYDRSTKWVRP